MAGTRSRIAALSRYFHSYLHSHSSPETPSRGLATILIIRFLDIVGFTGEYIARDIGDIVSPNDRVILLFSEQLPISDFAS